MSPVYPSNGATSSGRRARCRIGIQLSYHDTMSNPLRQPYLVIWYSLDRRKVAVLQRIATLRTNVRSRPDPNMTRISAIPNCYGSFVCHCCWYCTAGKPDGFDPGHATSPTGTGTHAACAERKRGPRAAARAEVPEREILSRPARAAANRYKGKGADAPVGTSAPVLLPPATRAGSHPQNPAARSSSRSRPTAAGECSGLFSLNRKGVSWRCRATVRLATMAAMATRLTPKVRISASRVEGGNGASAEAPHARKASCVPIACLKW